VGLSARTPGVAGRCSPAALGRTCAVAEARSQGRPEGSSAKPIAKRPLTASATVLSQGRQAPPKAVDQRFLGLRGLERAPILSPVAAPAHLTPLPDCTTLRHQ
jgi:hypothetical protein